MELSNQELLDVINIRYRYCPETGNYYSKLNKYGRKIGDIVGKIRTDGYILLHICGKEYLGHRLAFLIMENYLPKFVDHKDGNPSNNIWSNLRSCTHKENLQNTKINTLNTSGYKGVSLYENGKYRAYINIDGSFKSLGYFWDIEEANTAAKSARAEHFKEFARDE